MVVTPPAAAERVDQMKSSWFFCESECTCASMAPGRMSAPERSCRSFAAGIAALGGSPLIINPGESQLGHKESIADSARVFERQVSLIIWRTYAQAGLEEMAEHSASPVINSLSDDYHPCQLLADLLTVRERLGSLQGRKLAYLGDAANNMANSYLLAGVTAGMDVRIAGPAGYLPEERIIRAAEDRAAETGGKVTITADPAVALADAVNDLLDDPERRRQLGRAGPEWVQRFGWDRVASRLRELLEQIPARDS